MNQQQVIEVPDKPWMHESEINLIIAFLDSSHDMLEWGCGGSTILFPQHVATYDSIEHNKEWYQQVTNKVTDKNLSNVNTYWVPNEDNGGDFPSTPDRYKTYIEYPSQLNKKYDRILIDGRARQFCCEYCLPYIKPGGLIFFHDFWMQGRDRYRNMALKYYNEVASIIYSSQTLAVLQPKNYIA